MPDKQNDLETRFREKYAREYNPLAREKRMGAKTRKQAIRLQRKRMDEIERKSLQERIEKERDSQKLKEKMLQAKKEGILVAQKDAERLKTMEKARERMRAYIHQLEGKTATSAQQDNAFEKIRNGHAATGMEELSKAGREGSFGNEMADIDKGLVEQSRIIDKSKGNGGDEMRKILAANSAPMLTINQGKYALREEKEQKKNMEKKEERPQTAFTKDEFLKEKMRERLNKMAG